MFAKYFIDMTFSRQPFVLIFLIICLLSIHSSTNAQTDQSLGNYNTLIIKGKISPRFSLFSEDQLRATDYNLKYDYFEVKGGIFYSITPKLNLLFGTGLYNIYQPGGFFKTPAVQKEFRTWFELNFKQLYNRLNFEHRVRIEQRFIPENYKNRLRYRFGILVPVNKSKLVQGSLYIAVNDELWIPQYGLFLEMNRFFAGAGYKLNQNTTFQIGCISDTKYKPNSHYVKNYLQLMLIYDFTNSVIKHS